MDIIQFFKSAVKSSNQPTHLQVMYFTVPAPYLLMFVLLVRGATLEGAGEGIKYYLTPDFSKLLNYQVVK